MKKIFRRFKEKLTFKELPPPYQENEDSEQARVQQFSNQQYTQATCEVIDLLANCKNTTKSNDSDSEVEYAEIQEMGIRHSTPIAQRHKSKISLTWVLKENLENKLPNKNAKLPAIADRRYQRSHLEERRSKKECSDRSKNEYSERVVGRNEYYHNLRFKSACEEFANVQSVSDDTTSVGTEEYSRRKHRHRHRSKKRYPKFGYDIRDLDSFLSAASLDHPGNIPVVIAYPTTLYQTQRDLQRSLTLPLGTVVNAVFKKEQWVYVQTPHGDEGYVVYSACLPLGILPKRPSTQKKTPCWESSTDIYPRPCGNLTDTEKEQLRGRTRSECRYRSRKEKTQNSCAEKNFDNLYLKTKSVCSNLEKVHEKEDRRFRTRRQTLLVVTSDFKGSAYSNTLTVQKGDVVVLIEKDRDTDWFYVRKRDGSQGYIPAAIAGHGYI